MREFDKNYEEASQISASLQEIFGFADDHRNFSAHMNQSSWMMGGGRMENQADEGKFQKVGSHLKMSGSVFGINLSLDEVVTIHQPPRQKQWQTVGDINLLVIDHYQLGFKIIPQDGESEMKVYIDYDLPRSTKTKWLGYLFGGMYAKWCVSQMINSVKDHFRKEK